MKKLYLTIILIFVFSLCLTICISASSYGVYDELDALSDSEEIEVENALKKASEKTGFAFYVGIIPTNAEYYSSFKSRYSLYESDMVLLLIDDYYGTYGYVMHLFGNAVDEITVSEENKILDSSSVYDSIKYGNMASGICSFANQASRACGIEWGPVIAITVISFLVAGGIFLAIVIPRYKRKQRGTAYPFDQFTKVELTSTSDTFMTKTITRRRYRSSSSSSSGSRSGGGGGSRSSSRR